MKISYDEWKKRKPEIFRRIIELESQFQGRARGGRPRDPEKEKLLARLDRVKMESYIESGKIEILGPRRWRWRFGKPVGRTDKK